MVNGTSLHFLTKFFQDWAWTKQITAQISLCVFITIWYGTARE